MNENKSTTKQTPKKEEPKQPATQVEATAVQETQIEKSTPEPKQVEVQATPKQELPKSLNMAYLYGELQVVKQIIQEHGQQIAELLARKRKAVPNSKVQIVDKKTGQVFPSKNNCYQSLLKAGELKDLVDKGIFGPNPLTNNFGWFALQRALPDRFQEVKIEQTEPQV